MYGCTTMKLKKRGAADPQPSMHPKETLMQLVAHQNQQAPRPTSTAAEKTGPVPHSPHQRYNPFLVWAMRRKDVASQQVPADLRPQT